MILYNFEKTIKNQYYFSPRNTQKTRKNTKE